MTDTNNTTSPIAPEQMAAILSAAAQALLAQQPSPAAVLAADPASATGSATLTPASTQEQAQAPGADTQTAGGAQQPAAAALTPAASSVGAQQADAAVTDPEQLALLKKIDTNLTDLSTRIVTIEKTAIRNGAIAGSVAGGVSGGIVSAGIAFARAHLGI